jgi:hypothetical protein
MMTDEELIRAMQERQLLDEDQVEAMLLKLARTDEQWEGKHRHLLTIDAQLSRLTRHTNPLDFAHWLRYRAETGPSPHATRGLLDHGIHAYITWLQRLCEAYHHAAGEVFAEILSEGEEA